MPLPPAAVRVTPQPPEQATLLPPYHPPTWPLGRLVGVIVTGKVCCPNKMEIVLLPELATARSSRPSPLKSPTATESGEVPVAGEEARVKFPVPFALFSRMET